MPLQEKPQSDVEQENPQYEPYYIPRRGGFVPYAKTNIARDESHPSSGQEIEGFGRVKSLVVNPKKMPY
jgi:hypothetical protein